MVVGMRGVRLEVPVQAAATLVEVAESGDREGGDQDSSRPGEDLKRVRGRRERPRGLLGEGAGRDECHQTTQPHSQRAQTGHLGLLREPAESSNVPASEPEPTSGCGADCSEPQATRILPRLNESSERRPL